MDKDRRIWIMGLGALLWIVFLFLGGIAYRVYWNSTARFEERNGGDGGQDPR